MSNISLPNLRSELPILVSVHRTFGGRWLEQCMQARGAVGEDSSRSCVPVQGS